MAEWGSWGLNSKAAPCPIPCGLRLRSPKSNALLRVLPGSGHLLGPQSLHRTALSPSHLSAETQRAGALDPSGTDPSPSLGGDQSLSLCLTFVFTKPLHPTPQLTPPVIKPAPFTEQEIPLYQALPGPVPSTYDPIYSCKNALEWLLARSPFFHMRSLGTVR